MTFEVAWEAGEEARFWFWDQSHWPRPTVPLAATLELPAMAEGFTRACRTLARPFPAYHLKVVHGFVYFGFDLVRDAAARAAATATHRTVLALRIQDTGRFWAEDVLPEVQKANDFMRVAEWDTLPDEALARAIDDLYALRVRQWELHDLVLVPAMAALDAFLGLYAHRFPGAAPADAHALLRGLPNKTVESARALWRLAQDEQVRAWMAAPSPSTPLPDTERGEPTLVGSGSGAQAPLPASGRGRRRGLPPALAAYLDEYGWRTDGWELSDPALREEPAPLIARVRRYMAPGHPDPEQELARAGADRERRTAEALARLPDDAARAEFRAALDAARAYPVLSEDHNFYIDQMGLTSLRVPLLAMGRRLAARGRLERVDDVFYLTRGELVADLSPQPSSLKGGGRNDVGERPDSKLPSPKRAGGERSIPARRAERAGRWDERPPATIGTPLPPEMADDPLYAGFFGVGAEPPAGERVLRGVGAVPGMAAGRARVVRSLADADALEPGDILVCPMTSPAWTPLFATVAAVVADAGGTLSHTAIVAREYGIPCVVATRIASREIADGEWIEVDGTAGEVRRMTGRL